MTVEPLGDSAFIVRDLAGPAYSYAEAILELGDARILDANASYETLGIYTSPGLLTEQALSEILSRPLPPDRRPPRRHTIPVLYHGRDVSTVARQLNLSVDDVIALHTSIDYQCFAIGFCPGFPYLGWLPEKLQGIPRMATPRTRTSPGSVAMTGKQTAIYPLDRPGGWPIIGRTPLTLVDVDDNYFPIRAGDTVSFIPLTTQEEFEKLIGQRL